MDGLEPKLVTAVGFLFGVAAGGAIAGRLRGGSALRGRRCARCGASLSLVPGQPLWSWFAVRPRCRSCGAATGWLHPALETGAVLIGLLAIFALPLPLALLAAPGGWLLFLLAVRRWG